MPLVLSWQLASLTGQCLTSLPVVCWRALLCCIVSSQRRARAWRVCWIWSPFSLQLFPVSCPNCLQSEQSCLASSLMPFWETAWPLSTLYYISSLQCKCCVPGSWVFRWEGQRRGRFLRSFVLFIRLHHQMVFICPVQQLLRLISDIPFFSFSQGHV